MKKYNSNNFSRYKTDVKSSQPENKLYNQYTRDEMIAKFLPLVENIARKFNKNEASSGVLSLSDMIQFGNIGLIKAVDKLNWTTLSRSNDIEKTLKSFFSKRIRGAIRRATDANRSGMRLPEHKLNEIRNDFDNEKNSQMFFNSMFQSIDANIDNENSYIYQIEDNSEDPMKKEYLSYKIRDIMLEHLTDKEYNVLRLSFGLGCDKFSAKQIAEKLDMKGSSSYVRVSQLKKQAIDKLRNTINYSQVVDYL
mgnify:CR=1 FL=1